MKSRFLIFALMLASLGTTALRAQQVAAPVFNPTSETFTGTSVTLTITEATSGATTTVCYTASGTCAPGSTGTSTTFTGGTYSSYTAPTTSETKCASATAPGLTPSPTVCEWYANPGVAATAPPAFSEGGGTFTSTQTITVTETDTAAPILYCLSSSGTCFPYLTYSAALTVSSNNSPETICASAKNPADAVSSTSCNTYTIGGTGGGSGQWTTSGSNIYYNSGFVGIGTTNPEAPFTVSSVVVNGLGTNITLNTAFATGTDVNLVLGGDLNGTSIPYLQSRSGGSGNVIGSNNYNLAFNPYGGNVGIGTTFPQAKLEINGSLRFTGDGSVQSTAWTGVLCGGDYAEAVNAKGSLKTYEPGDVLVIGDTADGEVQKSAETYSTMVAGIYATKPGVIGRRQTLRKEDEELPMAMIGIVPTKVTTENGPIHRGDLLVTSSSIGYAMKGTDRGRLVGAVIGKAMGSLESGAGVVEVLVTLQ